MSTKTETNEFVLERTTWRNEKELGYSYAHYGFMVYRPNGYSLPKGWISSMNAMLVKPDSHNSRFIDDEVSIEFAIQSPTGDASDHCRYTIPCATWGQAIEIVDNYRKMVLDMIKAYEAEKKYLYT